MTIFKKFIWTEREELGKTERLWKKFNENRANFIERSVLSYLLPRQLDWYLHQYQFAKDSGASFAQRSDILTEADKIAVRIQTMREDV